MVINIDFGRKDPDYLNLILNQLSRSKFRASFKLSKKYMEYVNTKGMDKIRDHAGDFLNLRLRIMPKNDGRQTPYRGHPVFIAQHATATCCRGCMNKWYGISKDKVLTDEEIEWFVSLIMAWILKNISSYKNTA